MRSKEIAISINDENSYVNYFLSNWLFRDTNIVGKPIIRVDAEKVVNGRIKYIEDYIPSDTLYAKVIRIPVSNAIIKYINDSKIDLNDYVGLVTIDDVPGEKKIGVFARYVPEVPIFAEYKVKYFGEPLGLVIAKSLHSAEKARWKIGVEYQELPGVYNIMDALKPNAPRVHPDKDSNIAYKLDLNYGDVEQAFRKSTIILDEEYRFESLYHAYLAREMAIAIPEEDKMKIIIETQYPHSIKRIVASVLNMHESDIDVIVPQVGGSFCVKVDTGALLASQVAVAAYKYKQPVTLIYDIEDSFLVTPKKIDGIIKYKIGATSDGKINAVDAEIYIDTGAYSFRGPAIIMRPTLHITGAYEIPNVRVRSYLVYTNTVPKMGFRGFGNAETHFAVEMTMNKLARVLNMDPVELRLKNILKKGSILPTGKVIDEDIGLHDAVLKLKEIWDRIKNNYPQVVGEKVRSIGFAVIRHGILPDPSSGYVIIRRDGSVDVYTGIVELGQGTLTAITQVVAEILGIDIDLVRVHTTSDAPDTSGTYGSRGSNLGSMGTYIAAIKLRWRLLNTASKILGCDPLKIELRNKIAYCIDNADKRISWHELIRYAYANDVDLTATGYYSITGIGSYEKGSLDYPVYSFMGVIAEVEIDLKTFEVKVTKVWPAITVGKIINPGLAKSQINGGIIMGISMALTEELSFDENGKPAVINLLNYPLLRMGDIIDTEIAEPILIEDKTKYGPYGAKGIGEITPIPLPAAIAGAIYNAVDKFINEIPITRDKLYSLMNK